MISSVFSPQMAVHATWNQQLRLGMLAILTICLAPMAEERKSRGFWPKAAEILT
jgi:hypothetical protein